MPLIHWVGRGHLKIKTNCQYPDSIFDINDFFSDDFITAEYKKGRVGGEMSHYNRCTENRERFKNESTKKLFIINR